MNNANASHDIDKLLAGDEINTLVFYAEMARLGYDKVLRDNAVLGAIVYQIIQQYNGRGDALKDLQTSNTALADHCAQLTRERDALAARIERAMGIEAKFESLHDFTAWDIAVGWNEARDEFRTALAGAESEG